MLEASSFVFLHLVSRLLWRVHANHAKRERPRPIYYACHHQSWSDPLTSGDGITSSYNKFPFIPHIPGRGNSGGKINGPPLHLLKVGVHLP